MTHDVLARFADGSTVALHPATGALVDDGGTATVVAACVTRIAGLPPEEAARWLWGEADDGALASRRAGGTTLLLRDGERTATVPREQLVAVVRGALERRLAGETSWLFRRPPVAPVANEGDRVFLAGLEPRVAAFDDAVRARALDEATESARRRLLLAQLAEGGLLDEALLVEKLYWLRAFAFPALARVAAAALELWAYHRSPERRRIVGRDPPGELVSGALSLDWATAAADPPPGFSRLEWWAVAERELLAFAGLPPARGKLHLSQGPIRAELRYRPEDGTRLALYEAVWTSRP
jgi:hypothetical protein